MYNKFFLLIVTLILTVGNPEAAENIYNGIEATLESSYHEEVTAGRVYAGSKKTDAFRHNLKSLMLQTVVGADRVAMQDPSPSRPPSFKSLVTGFVSWVKIGRKCQDNLHILQELTGEDAKLNSLEYAMCHYRQKLDKTGDDIFEFVLASQNMHLDSYLFGCVVLENFDCVSGAPQNGDLVAYEDLVTEEDLQTSEDNPRSNEDDLRISDESEYLSGDETRISKRDLQALIGYHTVTVHAGIYRNGFVVSQWALADRHFVVKHRLFSRPDGEDTAKFYRIKEQGLATPKPLHLS